MFFLLRCAFWLGLVFLAMVRDAGGLPFVIEWRPTSATLAQAAVQIQNPACRLAKPLCVEDAKRPAPPNGRLMRAAKRHQTQSLDGADLAPAWRGPAGS